MSRDLTPKECDYIQKTYSMPNFTNVYVEENGEKIYMYSEEDRALANKYPRLGTFGFDLLSHCQQNGVVSSDKGQVILQKIEDYFNGKDIDDKELAENTQKWYEGKYCPGYYMNDNNAEFAAYLKRKISEQFILNKED